MASFVDSVFLVIFFHMLLHGTRALAPYIRATETKMLHDGIFQLFSLLSFTIFGNLLPFFVDSLLRIAFVFIFSFFLTFGYLYEDEVAFHRRFCDAFHLSNDYDYDYDHHYDHVDADYYDLLFEYWRNLLRRYRSLPLKMMNRKNPHHLTRRILWVCGIYSRSSSFSFPKTHCRRPLLSIAPDAL